MSLISKPREAAFAVIAIVFSVSVCLGVAEIFARLWLGSEPVNEGKLFKNKSIKIGVEGNDGWESVFFPNNRPVVVGIETNINNLGLRDFRDRSFEKAENTRRIGLFGDSFTFGHGNQDEQTLPAHLERDLNAIQNSANVEVLNFGVQGFNSTESYIYLSRFGSRFDLDVAVLIWLYDDFDRRGYRIEDLARLAAGETFSQDLMTARKSEAMNRTQNESVSLSHWLRANFDLYNYFIGPKLKYLADKTFGLDKVSGEAVYTDFEWGGAKLSLKSIQHAAQFCREKNIEFRVVIFPALHSLNIDYHQKNIYSKLENFCRENDIPALNLFNTVFKGLNQAELVVSRRDFHANDTAQGMAAAAIADWLMIGH